MSLTYRSAIDQLLSLADFERKWRAAQPPGFHLKRTGRLLSAVGDPHLSIPTVHVAGSKGKGSTAAMISAALSAGGHRTGLYSSPSIHRITERIRVDMRPIDEHDFAGLVERLWPLVKDLESDSELGPPSVFELQTVMAFVHFADTQTDIAVIEVGLGGRLDSTNVVQPAVSVITPISLDHTSVLGNAIELIAAEKAGIIKQGTPVVVSRQVAAARQVIDESAALLAAPVVDASKSVQLVSADPRGVGPQKFTVIGSLGTYDLSLRMLGEHQIDNARSAIATLECLSEVGFRVTPEAVGTGLAGMDWPARGQIVETRPNLIVADGAHNADSALALLALIRRHFPGISGTVLILGATRGHDCAATARALAPLSPRIVVTQSRHPKAVAPDDLAATLADDNIYPVAITNDTDGALAVAREIAGDGDLIVASGTLFVAAEVIERVCGIEPELYPDLRAPVPTG